MQLPPYPVFPELNAGDYRLRQIKSRDLDNILEILFYDGQRAESIEDAGIILGKIDQDYLGGNGINWGIEHRASRKIIGTCGFYRGFDGDAGEVGCILKEAFRGRGIMKDAIASICQFGIQEMGLKRIFAITDVRNIQAQQLLSRLHFIKLKEITGGQLEYELCKSAAQEN